MKKLFLAVLLFCNSNMYATHLMGADLSYSSLDSLRFKITLKWYRDCRGISLGTSSISAGDIQVRCGGSVITVSLGLMSIKDITPLCASEPSRCNPVNTRNTGEGVEEHVYTGIIDFNKAPLNSLVNCSERIVIGASQNARNGAITTGPSGSLYTQAEIDLKKAPKNSSPTYTTFPIIFLCCDQAFYENCGAIDSSDYDSLSYAWASPLRAYNNITSYSGSFSYQNPFTVYDPRPNGGAPVPGNTPPIGLYLDSLTGDFVLTPVNCAEVTVAVIEITEWRKNNNGKYEIIGKNRRDMQFIVKSCPGNFTPLIKGKSNYVVCENSELCFDIATYDSIWPGQIPDTLDLIWNNSIKGASFSILDSTKRLKTGRFCWTPPIGSASSIPYYFTVTVNDDACPINSISRKNFTVTVVNNNHNLGGDTLVCGNELFLKSESSGKKYWSTGDTTDGILVDSSGLYTVFNKGVCSVPDSIYVTFVQNDRLNLGKDTSFCGDSIIIKTGTSYVSYLWNDLSNDSIKIINKSGTYIVEVIDTNGCSSKDSIKIVINKNNQIPIISKNGNLITSNLGGRHHWFKNDTLLVGSYDSFLKISTIGDYSAVKIDTNGCESEKSNIIKKIASLPQILKNRLKTYPNPSNGSIRVNIEYLDAINQIKIVDAQGKKINHTYDIIGNTLMISYGDYSGIFWLIISTDTKTYVQEITHF